MTDYGYVKNNYDKLLSELDSLAGGRDKKVTLVAVTKSGTDEELLALAAAGVTDIGENRPGELKRRGELLAENGYAPLLHEIGSLQRNKVKYIIDKVSLIHSLDSERLAEEIDRQAKKIGRRVPVLIEINSAREENKGGILPECAEDFFLKVREYESLDVCGLMTMGPPLDNPEGMRPYFKLTKEIFDRIQSTYGFKGDPILSMGMSDSYAVAIEEGATLVRIGRRLFDKTLV